MTRRDSKGRFTQSRTRPRKARKSRSASTARVKTIRVPKGTKVRIVRTGGRARKATRRKSRRY